MPRTSRLGTDLALALSQACGTQTPVASGRRTCGIFGDLEQPRNAPGGVTLV
jgi:hypothetical protein